MLTLERARGMDDTALAWTSKDIYEALAAVGQMKAAGIPVDEKRASEYADELALVAQVRYERKNLSANRACPHCGRRG